MDGTKFDAITQGLAEVPTRRRLLGGLLGGATLLTGATLAFTDADAKKGKGRANGKGKGRRKAHGKHKVTICHKIDSSTFVLKNVPTPALNGHLGHGDSRCEVGVCQTGDPTGCTIEGVCTFAAAEDGTECTTAGGEVGTCQTGVCVV